MIIDFSIIDIDKEQELVSNIKKLFYADASMPDIILTVFDILPYLSCVIFIILLLYITYHLARFFVMRASFVSKRLNRGDIGNFINHNYKLLWQKHLIGQNRM
jgi:formate hydrogenlyase subunit 4